MFSLSEKRKIMFSNYIFVRYPLLILFITFMILGCDSVSEDKVYTNSQFGIRLEKSENWNLEYIERNGSIVIKAENESEDSARIEIYGFACVPSLFKNSEEALKSELERTHAAYDLESVTIIQEPRSEQINGFEIATAVISLPTMSLPEDSVINQVGQQDPDVFQMIQMFAIRDQENNSILVYVYQGRSEKLNTEAEGIIDSIEFTCSTEA